MDQVKTGRLIAECRKGKGLTQAQLAEMLNTTNKSVSKWENGNCLPDTSLFEPLCGILGITINELFAGQRMEKEDYQSITDANLLQMLKQGLYNSSNKSITFAEFGDALAKMAETATKLKQFKTKEDAVGHLAKETGLSTEECSSAYDIYISLLKTDQDDSRFKNSSTLARRH